MKRNLPARILLVVGLFGLALSAGAQATTATPSGGSTYGLLGEHYSGLRYTYTDIDDGPLKVMHSYGFVANRPTSQHLDAMFKYEYARASAVGLRSQQHMVAAGATAYLPATGVRPFIEGNVGWIFQKADLGRRDSFMFLVAAGFEIQLAPQYVLTPYVGYQEMPHFDDQTWSFGVKAAYRIAREWSVMIGFQTDEHENVEYRFGVNRHF